MIGTIRTVLAVALAACLAGCVAAQDGGPGSTGIVATASPEQRMANCAERVKLYTAPHSMMIARHLLRVRTDDEAAPLLCRKIGKAVAEGRLTPDDLTWDDGAHPMSMRLVRVLREG